MNQYNFNILSPLEFEEFARDILSAVHNVEYQTYSDGKDGGIDVRYMAKGRADETIIQCKRYKSVRALMGNLLHKERPKLDRIKPKRYILVLSLDLSIEQVDKLTESFAPYIESPHDIIMPKQLNAYLAKNPQIEKRHFKLWLTSTNVLDMIVHSGIESYTVLTRHSIEEAAALFVPLPNMQEAIDKLRENGFIIIVGQPGVGKTTLAKMMAYKLLGDKEDGFTELVSIPRDFNEVLAKLSADPEKYQVFYFDDFLGTNFLDHKFDRREDSVLHELVISAKRLKKSKVMIMTTREYILQQAGQSSRHLEDQGILDARYIVNLDDYSLDLKSRILYNHIANFDLPEAHLQFFLDNKVYRKLIQHRNYSPRLIEGIGQYRMWADTTPEEFCDKLVASFDNPKLLYEHAYENEIDSTARDLLLILMSIGTSVKLRDLYTAVKAYNNCDYNAFEKAVDVIDGTFIATNSTKGEIMVSFSNPSVHDFMVEYYRNRVYTLTELLQKAVFLNQLIHAFALRKPVVDPSKIFGNALRPFGMFFDKIIVDEHAAVVIEQRLLSDRKQLPLIKSSGQVEDYADDLFDRATRLTNDEITTEAVTKAVLGDVKAGLLEDKITNSDMHDVLYIYEYFAETFNNNAVLEQLANLIAASAQSFEDLSLIHDLSLNSEHNECISVAIEAIIEYGNVDAIIDDEITERLSDAENPDSVVSIISSTSEAYGVDEYEIRSRVDGQIHPDEIDEARFYSRTDDDYERHREISSDRESVMDDIFESLRM